MYLFTKKINGAEVDIWNKDIDIHLAFWWPSFEWWSHVWVYLCVYYPSDLTLFLAFSYEKCSYRPPIHQVATQDCVLWWLPDQIRKIQNSRRRQSLHLKTWRYSPYIWLPRWTKSAFLKCWPHIFQFVLQDMHPAQSSHFWPVFQAWCW